jgi:hypothetical protein
MISAIFALSGGPPAAELITPVESAEILRIYCGWHDNAERLHVLTSIVIKPANGAARNA